MLAFTRLADTEQRGSLMHEIWMTSAADPNPTFLTVGRISAFSPDGSRLSFTRQDEAGMQQVWFYYFDTGQAVQVTPSGVGHYGSTTWSPDGTQIASFYVPGRW